MFVHILLVLSCLLYPIMGFAQDFRPQPEISTDVKKSVNSAVSDKDIVVTAHPEATKAARVILEQGGTAIDAMVAAQLVLGLVEPQSSGLGGGAFLLYYDAQTGVTHTLDGRETAPALAPNDMFLDDTDVPMGFYDAAHNGLSVGVPGTPKLLKVAHQRFGQSDWSLLFSDALRLAEDGFNVTSRLSTMAIKSKEALKSFPIANAYFSGAKEGVTLSNKPYAKTLMHYRDNDFYEGAVSSNIVHAVKSEGGYISQEDMLSYEVKDRDTLCDTYRGYKICSMNEPSSGGLTVLQVLKMLERFDLSEGATSLNLHRLIEASRLAFADRGQYMADRDFSKTPNRLLLAEKYVHGRSLLIGGNALKDVSYGIPQGWDDVHVSDVSREKPGTSHISIIDRFGNAVSMTTTIESAFGSHIMVGGVLLNNELTDFSFIPEKDGKSVANAIVGGKRPRSSMAPTIVFNPDGTLFMVIGSAGGSRIIGYVLQRLIAVIDWNMTLEDAVSMPHILSRGDAVDVEIGHSYPVEELRQLGHTVNERDLNSGLTAIYVRDGKYIGVADPRREGTVQ